MSIYHVIRKSDGAMVYAYNNDTRIEFEQWPMADFEQVDMTSDPEPVDTRVFGGRRRLTKLELIALLGDDFVAILAASKQSIQIEAFVEMVRMTTPDSDGYSINLDDPRFQAVRQLEFLGVIGSGRAAEILNG